MTDLSGSNILKTLYPGSDGFVAVLAAKRLAGVAPEVNLREHVTCTPLPSANKAAYSGFETQRRRHQKSKTGDLQTLFGFETQRRRHRKSKTGDLQTLCNYW